jgi:AcrR family transcriptional regulator
MSRSTSEPERKSGRPARGEEDARRDGLLRAALDVFLQHGFAGTSLDDISRVAHVAKRTIYDQFGGKEGLFAACIDRAAQGMIGQFASSEPAVRDIGSHLTDVGCTVLTFILRPESLAIYRLVVGEAARQPILARLFYERGPARVIASVAALLDKSLGRNPQGESERHARDFISLVVLEIQQRAVLGLLDPMNRVEIEKHVAIKVATFLAAMPKEVG